jgi:hypothetical protein
MTEPVSLLFARVCDLGIALGWENISLDAGCKEHDIDEHWWFAINPHGERTKCSKGAEVPPYSIYFQFNGWPAGVIDAGGGVLAAGKLANEDTLIAAIDAAIERQENPA